MEENNKIAVQFYWDRRPNDAGENARDKKKVIKYKTVKNQRYLVSHHFWKKIIIADLLCFSVESL